ERAALHRLDRVLERVLRGDHHHRDVAAERAQALEQLEARRAGHADVEEGDVERLLGERLPGRVARVDDLDVVALLLERLAQHEADRGLVVGDQDAGARRLAHEALRSGSETRTRAPSPARLSTWSAPPCSATKWRE